MKRIITFITLALLIPSITLAFTNATLFKGLNRIAVSSQEQANKLFSSGYKLEEKMTFGLAAPSSANMKYVQSQPYTLAGSGAVLGATSITLKSFKNIDGTLLTMSNFGTQGFGTIEPSVSNEEQITFYGVTQNVNGTATLTGVKTVLNIYPYTETTGIKNTHSGGTKFVLSNTAGFYNTFANKENDETISGKYDFSKLPYGTTTAPTDPREFVTTYQLQQATSTGGVNGSELVAGKWQGATQAQTALGTAIGSTGANLAIQSKYATSSSDVATTSVVVTQTTGKIKPNFLNGTDNYTFNGNSTFNGTTTATGAVYGFTSFGGDGSDGALNVTSGTTTLSASSANILVKNYSSINISTGTVLTLSNKASDGTILILKSKGACTIAGKIDLKAMGADAITNGFGILDVTADHKGGVGAGGGSASGTPGTVGTILGTRGFYVTPDYRRLNRRFLLLAVGSGGAAGSVGYDNAVAGALGGVGGVGGGALIIECAGALNFVAGAEVNIDGGNGSAGASAAGAGAGGGGSGGSAGMALIMYNSLTANSGTINAKGGTGGAGGTASGGGGCNSGDTGGGGGSGAGSYTATGFLGGTGGLNLAAGTTGSATTNASGAGGGGGGGCGGAGASGGSQGSTDTNHYLVTKNLYY